MQLMKANTNTIVGANLFESGTHNGLTFTDSDLDGIVDSFNALKLAGRVPVKFGHRGPDTRTDGSPALGWVQRIYREGSKLMGDITDIPTVVYNAIAKKLYKFVSIELLKGVRAGTAVIPWTLDAVALLGATAPAVGTLKPLLEASRAQLEFEESISFTRSEETDDDMTDTTKEEFAALTRRHIALLFETKVRAGDILPRDREMFNRRFPDASVADAEAYLAQTPKPPKTRETVSFATGHTTVVPGSGRADFRVLEAAQKVVLERRQVGDPLPGQSWEQLLAAAKLTVAREPDLAKAWQDAPGES